ncbi:BZ3500_MvSof-1268-A1-R1_Chr7-1g09315 [Microbotryum saponariae]|uniref:BZ3500_MvSof-1268-A1-R1_Chr7-1g09315 protein n=1 Tax=Microbotryum saponariae TaxID=289078 RepID=A0A2X0LBZ1_9BASI|nr:BZ3501_MvSof-1269-A2-R1_Chr7-1g09020 [Microbotryum saponariae]SDA03219.1 BZ3500_MvSof-1268-A1-R1_Chr7-1g09315 [Microbotryum saponariae]
MSTPSLLTGKWLYRALLQQAQQLPDTHVTDHYRHLIKSDFRKPLPLDRSRAHDRTVQAQKVSSRVPLRPSLLRSAHTTQRTDPWGGGGGLVPVRFVRRSQLLRRLMAANEGHLHAIERVLDQAYQRKGKGSHTLLEPFLSPSRQTKLFNSPSLRSLLTSPLSHTSRNPTAKQLDTPPTLPPRAFPHSEEARLMGPLIPQRVKAIRRRYWNSQTGKIKKPLAVLVQGSEPGQEGEGMKREDLLKKVGLVGLGQDLEKVGRERLQLLERWTSVGRDERPRRSRRLRGVSSALIGPEEEGSSTWTDSTRLRLSSSAKEKDEGAGAKTSEPRKASSSRTTTTTIPNLSLPKWSTPKVLRPRFMRRRYEALLEDAPIVTVEGKAAGTKGGGDAKRDGDKNKEKDKKNSTSDGPADQERQVWVKVRLSEFAKSGNGRLGKVGEEDAWWIDR